MLYRGLLNSINLEIFGINTHPFIFAYTVQNSFLCKTVVIGNISDCLALVCKYELSITLLHAFILLLFIKPSGFVFTHISLCGSDSDQYWLSAASHYLIQSESLCNGPLETSFSDILIKNADWQYPLIAMLRAVHVKILYRKYNCQSEISLQKVVALKPHQL